MARILGGGGIDVTIEQHPNRVLIDRRGIRGVDGDAVVETLLARGLIAVDPCFGGRGRPTFLVTTPIFLRTMGLWSLAELPPRPAPTAISAEPAVRPPWLRLSSIRASDQQPTGGARKARPVSQVVAMGIDSDSASRRERRVADGQAARSRTRPARVAECNHATSC